MRSLQKGARPALPSQNQRQQTPISFHCGVVLVVSVVNGELKEVCSAKVRNLGEKVGQAWRLRVHPQSSSKAAYVNRKGDVKWNLHEIEVPTVEQSVREDALVIQDIRELGLG